MKKRLRMFITVCLLTALSALNLNCTNSDRITECLNSKNRNIVNELHTKIDNRIRENFDSDDPYLDFTSKFFHSEIDEEFYKIEKGSELEAIILEALRTKSWHIEIGNKNVSGGFGNTPRFELPDVPLFSQKKEKRPPNRGVFLKSDSEVIQCMKDNAPTPLLKEYYEKHETLKGSNPSLILDVFRVSDELDLKSTYSQYFVTLDVIMTHIFKENDYEKHLEEKFID